LDRSPPRRDDRIRCLHAYTLQHRHKLIYFLNFFANNFLMNNDRRIKSFKDYSGQWPWQHMSRSWSSKGGPLFCIIIKTAISSDGKHFLVCIYVFKVLFLAFIQEIWTKNKVVSVTISMTFSYIFDLGLMYYLVSMFILSNLYLIFC